jgi:SAM-dependent methyltransferase
VLCLGCAGGYQRHEHVCAADVNLDFRYEIGFRNFVLHDLNLFPYPFEDDEFEKVFASHVLEHLDEPQKALYEMLRIARTVEIYVPHRYSRYAKQKDHKSVFSTSWFKKALVGLPVIYEQEVLWGFPIWFRPKEIHVVILKKGGAER